MRTPKEVLLQKHENVESRLHLLRREVIRERVKRESVDERADKSLAMLLRGIFWPSPRAWAGVAAVWVVIAFLNFSGSENGSSSTAMAKTTPRSPETLQALREQKQVFAELVNMPWEASEAERPRFVPRPRSDRRQVTFVV